MAQKMSRNINSLTPDELEPLGVLVASMHSSCAHGLGYNTQWKLSGSIICKLA